MTVSLKSNFLAVSAVIVGSLTLLGYGLGGPANPEDFFTQRGTDKTFAEILSGGDLPRGSSSDEGVKGSRIRINDSLFKDFPYTAGKIPQEIKIHTLGNSAVQRSDFERWSRWYQEDGSTQVFRLFKDEENVHNDRKLAARIEAFSELNWQQGEWHEWAGTFTIIKPHSCSILQVMNDKSEWAVHVGMGSNGDVRLNQRKGEDRVIAREMLGKPFHICVRDNGLDYMVYLNGVLQAEGSYPRPEGSKTNFRWGMYLGGNEVKNDAMILVTGAMIDPSKMDFSKFEPLAAAAEKAPASEAPVVSEEIRIPERAWTNKDGAVIKAAAIYKAGEDSVRLKVGDRWIAYPLADLSPSDRKALLVADANKSNE